MERHNTHAVSSYSSSSNNHSYDFDNNSSKKTKKINSKKLNLRNLREINEPQLSNIQLKKINSILNKYNIVSEQSQKNEELSKHQKKTENNKEEQEIKLDKNILTTKNNAGEPNKAKRKDSKKSKKKKTKDSNKDKENNKDNKEKGKEENKDNKEEQKKEENKKEDEKIEEIYKKEETTKNDDLKYENEKLKYYVSYRKNIKDTRFNNIQKILDDENKKKIKLKKFYNRNKEKLLIYKEVNVKQDNLVREIKKPPISFITKIFKGLDQQLEEKNQQMEENSGLLLTVKNNYGFYTKQFIRNKEFNKKIKQIKYQKMKEELKDEKIPTFSSINTSSSNSLFKTKSKSKSKKKTFKNKNKIKPKSFGKKKQNLFPKSMKPQRSISVYSKVSKEKSEEGKKSTSKKRKIIIPNIKKKQTYVSNKKIVGVNKDIRKYSFVGKYNGKFSNIQKDIDKKDENKKINENNNEKESREIDFKKFLEQQKIKKSRQIKNYIKKNGINSYNFFYPKEPSPLLSTFKNKYSIYPTLYLDRKNSVDIGVNNNIIINHRHFYKVRYRPRKGKTFYEKENSTNDYLHNHNKNKNNNIHLVDKHYGLEKDCPICRAFQMKILNDDFNSVNYIKSMKYKKLKINENLPRVLSPNSFGFINERDYSSLSRNRNSSAGKSEYVDEYSQIRRNFVAVFDYFNL